jgi:DNA replication initiation complex subunit (GINS family)
MAPPVEPLTFEDVTKVYREEKKSARLTAIRHDFYSAVRELMEQLKRDFEKEAATDSYSTKARQLNQSISKMREKVLQIYDMRAEKVMLMAVLGAAGGKMDHSRLTDEEKQLLEGSLAKIKEMRNSLLDMPRPGNLEFTRMSSMPMPKGHEEEPGIKLEQLAPITKEEDDLAQPPLKQEEVDGKGPCFAEAITDRAPVEVATPDGPPLNQMQDIILLRILEDIPPFAGPSGTYRLGKEDVVTLPSGIGKVLIKRGKAAEIMVGQ